MLLPSFPQNQTSKSAEWGLQEKSQLRWVVTPEERGSPEKTWVGEVFRGGLEPSKNYVVTLIASIRSQAPFETSLYRNSFKFTLALGTCD